MRGKRAGIYSSVSKHTMHVFTSEASYLSVFEYRILFDSMCLKGILKKLNLVNWLKKKKENKQKKKTGPLIECWHHIVLSTQRPWCSLLRPVIHPSCVTP